jgi:hypothetical protein
MMPSSVLSDQGRISVRAESVEKRIVSTNDIPSIADQGSSAMLLQKGSPSAGRYHKAGG